MSRSVLATWVCAGLIGCSLLSLPSVAAERAEAGAARQGQPSEAKVNVNTAGTEELATLPGVGPSLAQRIVEHRQKSGPFNRAEDLLAVKGIGAKLLERIKPRLSFESSGR